MCDVTVLLPVYNGMPYLPEAVESILNQTYKDWQMIIVNDGSTDGSTAFLDGLDDSRVRIFHQTNQGLSAALNHGIRQCQTEFLARMDADDVSLPERLAIQKRFLEKNPNVGLVGSQIQRLGECRVDRGSALPTRHAGILSSLMQANHAICHPAIMGRTRLFKDVDGYWDGLGEEWDLFLKIGERMELANVDQILLSYRVHRGSLNGEHLPEMHQRFRYACECSKRRVNNLPQLSYDSFMKMENEISLWRRLGRQVQEHSRAQYFIAQVDLLGKHQARGYARLAYAAVCNPALTMQRVFRTARRRWIRRNANSI